MVNFAGSRSRPLIAETITGVVREARLGLIVRSVSIHVNLMSGGTPTGGGSTERTPLIYLVYGWQSLC